MWHLQAQLLHLPTCQSLWLTFLIVSTLPRINIKIVSKSKLYGHSLGRQKGGGIVAAYGLGKPWRTDRRCKWPGYYSYLTSSSTSARGCWGGGSVTCNLEIKGKWVFLELSSQEMKAKVLKSQCLFWRTLSDNERTLLTKHLAGASHYRSLTRAIIWSLTEGETQGQVLSVEGLCRDHRPSAHKYVCFGFYSLCQSKLTPLFCPPPHTISLSLWKCENPILQMFVLKNSWARAVYSGFPVIAMSWNVIKRTLAWIKTIYELASKSWSRSLITIILIKPHWVSYYKPIRPEKVLCFKILRHFVGCQQGLVKVWAATERPRKQAGSHSTHLHEGRRSRSVSSLPSMLSTGKI